MILYHEKKQIIHPSSINFYAAHVAFVQMGFEIKEVEKPENLEQDSVVLGSIQFVYNALENMGFSTPAPLDYPDVLSDFLGRKVWESTINTIANHPEQWNVFVKPKGLTKKFTGKLIKNITDLRGMGNINGDIPVWVSEPVTFLVSPFGFTKTFHCSG